MNKKQFATKLMASILSASLLAPCATTFGVEGEPLSSETVSISEKNQVAQSDEYAQEDEDEYDGDDEQEDDDAQEDREDHKDVTAQKRPKKCILKNPYADAIGGGIGLGALIFGGSRLWKHFSSGRHPQSPAGGGSVTPPAAPVEPQALPEDRTGWNELHYAAEAGNFEAFNNIERSNVRLQALDSRNRTPFYIAVKYHPKSDIVGHWVNDDLDISSQSGQSETDRFSRIIYLTLCRAVLNDDVQIITNLINITIPHFGIDPQPIFDYELPGEGRVFDTALRNHRAAAQCLIANAPAGCSYAVTYNEKRDTDAQARLAELRELRAQGYSLESFAAHPETIFRSLCASKKCEDIFRFYIDECHVLPHLPNHLRNILRTQLSNYPALREYFNQKCNEQPLNIQ